MLLVVGVIKNDEKGQIHTQTEKEVDIMNDKVYMKAVLFCCVQELHGFGVNARELWSVLSSQSPCMKYNLYHYVLYSFLFACRRYDYFVRTAAIRERDKRRVIYIASHLSESAKTSDGSRKPIL